MKVHQFALCWLAVEIKKKHCWVYTTIIFRMRVQNSMPNIKFDKNRFLFYRIFSKVIFETYGNYHEKRLLHLIRIQITIVSMYITILNTNLKWELPHYFVRFVRFLSEELCLCEEVLSGLEIALSLGEQIHRLCHLSYGFCSFHNVIFIWWPLLRRRLHVIFGGAQLVLRVQVARADLASRHSGLTAPHISTI